MNFNLDKYIEDGLFLLSKLVSFETVLNQYDPKSDAPFGKENKEALHFMLDYAKHDGFLVFNDHNYAGHIEFGKGKETLGILAHLDVVPVEGQNWNTDPFTLTIQNDKLFGRGTIDDKGPLVAAYIAMKMLKDNGFEPKKQIRLIMGCDEESGSRCLTHYFKENKLPEFGFSPDADFPLIYGEKAHMTYVIEGNVDDKEIVYEMICGTRLNVVPAKATMKLKKDYKKEYQEFLKKNNYKGEIIGEDYVAYGIASHAMVPEKGLNAAFILFQFLDEVESTKLSSFFTTYFTFDPFGKKMGYDLYDEEMKELTSNVGIINIKNGKVWVGVDCRVPRESHFEKMKSCIEQATNSVGLTAKIEGFGGYHYVDPKGFLVSTLLHAYQDITKDTKSKPITIGGGTYAKFIKNAVAFGPMLPGREDGCHIANEYMLMDDFKIMIQVYAKAIYELTK
ncbi:MAG: Sapep family Mn(2+)-dependent dipeptidase [Anaeroplasmataceae bacterium]|nr:Sapep family Mn(2+)-dependent dipeptidase [Anaeroplasmataceae bacterium]